MTFFNILPIYASCYHARIGAQDCGVVWQMQQRSSSQATPSPRATPPPVEQPALAAAPQLSAPSEQASDQPAQPSAQQMQPSGQLGQPGVLVGQPSRQNGHTEMAIAASATTEVSQPQPPEVGCPCPSTSTLTDAHAALTLNSIASKGSASAHPLRSHPIHNGVVVLPAPQSSIALCPSRFAMCMCRLPRLRRGRW